MRYYKDWGVPIGEIAPPTAFTVESARQQEIAKAIGNRNFAVGEIVEAIVSAIKSIEVTYEIVVTKQRLSKKEHKKAKSLKIGQKVKVEILEIKEDGSIKKIRLIEWKICVFFYSYLVGKGYNIDYEPKSVILGMPISKITGKCAMYKQKNSNLLDSKPSALVIATDSTFQSSNSTTFLGIRKSNNMAYEV